MSLGPLANLSGGLSVGASAAPVTLFSQTNNSSECRRGTGGTPFVGSGRSCSARQVSRSPRARAVGFAVCPLPPSQALLHLPSALLSRAPEPLPPPPHAQTPPAVPGPSAPFIENVTCLLEMSPNAVAGLQVTCADTGVTLSSVCGSSAFHHNALGTKTYSGAAGPGFVCGFGQTIHIQASSGVGSGSGSIDIIVWNGP